MTTTQANWRKVAGGFTVRADAVARDAWNNSSPCEGWVARDIVAHLVEWIPGFLRAGAGIELRGGPRVEADPAVAWRHLAAAIETILDGEASARRFEHPQAGNHTVEEAIATFVLPDVLIHTWDLARATGQDETLDAEMVRAQLIGMKAIDEAALVASGHYGPRVPVAPEADEQTRLIALTGRQPE